MPRWFFLLIALAGFALVQSLNAADDKDEPKKPPPAIAELLKSGPEEFIKRHDKNKDGYLTKDELPPALARIFDRLDTNGDGKLDKDEVAAMFKMLRQRFEAGKSKETEKKNEPEKKKVTPVSPEVEKMVDSLLERMDTNKDGKISKEEARGPLAQNFERWDLNKDGFLDRDELRKGAAVFLAYGGPGSAAGSDRARADFDALDKNADGRLTRDELKGTRYADQFDEIDTNKDGKIDRKEFAAYLKKQAEKKEP